MIYFYLGVSDKYVQECEDFIYIREGEFSILPTALTYGQTDEVKRALRDVRFNGGLAIVAKVVKCDISKDDIINKAKQFIKTNYFFVRARELVERKCIDEGILLSLRQIKFGLV